ncbi:Aste57867_18600 [Aphanomyces stellatus]|uniref:Aste57867_18600 protein n=1 Tax=Aphanomyces stellatus TaxID=120398 RepID=A0A485LAR8_9STRA|nr:hypothetical protein As57867_018538 [Aphanomyces stellatus]VFT95335.1 Aste57867_18600 [Aphanomyces stellatus]
MSAPAADVSSMDMIRHPGEYTCVVSHTTSLLHCMTLSKPLLSKVHVVKTVDTRTLAALVVEQPDGWSSLHEGHVLVAVNGECVDHMRSSELKAYLMQCSTPYSLTFCHIRRRDVELALQRTDVRGSIMRSCLSPFEMERMLQQVQALIFANDLDAAFGLLSSLPPGAHALVAVYKAEVQCIRALVAGDTLSKAQAVAESDAGAALLARMAALPQLSPVDKLTLDLARAEALAFASVARLLSSTTHSAVPLLRKCHALYTRVGTSFDADSVRLWMSDAARQDMRGRVHCGLGIFALLADIVPPELRWVLALVHENEGMTLHAGMALLHSSWSAPNRRSHWAGLALMNATPMLLQHWVAANHHHKAASRTSSATTTDESSASDCDDDREGDDPTTKPRHDNLLLQSSTLRDVAAACLARHPTWVLVLWAHSTLVTQSDPHHALTLARAADTAWGADKLHLAYPLRLHLGRLHFKCHAFDDATTVFEGMLSAQAKTQAAAINVVEQAACIYLAACLCLETRPNFRFVRTLLARASRLDDPSSSTDGTALFVRRARHYRDLSITRLQLLPFDLLYLCSDNTHHHRRPAYETTSDHAAVLARLDALLPPHAFHSAEAVGIIEGDAGAFLLDALTLRAIVLLHVDPTTASAAFSHVLALASLSSVSSFAAPVASFYLARELASAAPAAAVALLDKSSSDHRDDDDAAAGYLSRRRILRAVVARQLPSANIVTSC